MQKPILIIESSCRVICEQIYTPITCDALNIGFIYKSAIFLKVSEVIKRQDLLNCSQK